MPKINMMPHPVTLKMGSRFISGIFHYRKDKQLYGYLVNIKEVLIFINTTCDKQLKR